MFSRSSDNSAETIDWVGIELLSIKGHGPHVSMSWRYFPTPEPQLHSLSSHFPHTHSLSRRKNKRRKGWTRVRKWRRRWRREPRLQRVERSSTWASTISHLMVSSRITSSQYLEINTQTLTQVFSLAWMDHEDLLMGSNPSKKSLFSLEARMASVDLQPWWQGTYQEPKLSCHAQSLFIFRICS